MDVTGNNELPFLMEEWLRLKKIIKDAQDKEKEIKTSLFNHLNRNKTDIIVCGQYEIERTYIKPCPGKEITIDMVGEVIGKRKGSERITINKMEIEKE